MNAADSLEYPHFKENTNILDTKIRTELGLNDSYSISPGLVGFACGSENTKPSLGTRVPPMMRQ